MSLVESERFAEAVAFAEEQSGLDAEYLAYGQRPILISVKKTPLCSS